MLNNRGYLSSRPVYPFSITSTVHTEQVNVRQRRSTIALTVKNACKTRIAAKKMDMDCYTSAHTKLPRRNPCFWELWREECLKHLCPFFVSSGCAINWGWQGLIIWGLIKQNKKVSTRYFCSQKRTQGPLMQIVKYKNFTCKFQIHRPKDIL